MVQLCRNKIVSDQLCHNWELPIIYASLLPDTDFNDVILLVHQKRRGHSFRLSLMFLRKDLKPVFHFNRIVAKRSVFHCFVNTHTELMIWTQ